MDLLTGGGINYYFDHPGGRDYDPIVYLQFSVAYKVTPRLTLDFSKVEFVPSATLGKLLTLHKDLQAVEGRLELCGLDPTLRNSLRKIFPAGWARTNQRAGAPPLSPAPDPRYRWRLPRMRRPPATAHRYCPAPP
jgi:hypothetical protein